MTEPASRPVRVRFAPSPTGRLHLGGARTALFNWAFARRHGGRFVLRVEDTDRARNTEESLTSILDSLRWLGLDWDEGPEVGGEHGPYFQSERQGRHREALERGLREGWLYRCFVPLDEVRAQREAARAAKGNWRFDPGSRELDPREAERRAAAGEPHVVRMRVPEGERLVIHDHVRGEVTFDSSEVEDWVVARADGVPTYNFACALDDADMAVTHVIRGEEHLVNTPKQMLVRRFLGLPEPEYAHVPLILGADGRKLSKRTGDTAVEDYRARGYPPEALFNFLALLGFSIDDKTTLFSPDELVRHFELGRIQKGGAVFDPVKLDWMAGEYLRATPTDELARRVLPWMQEAGLVPDEPSAADLERLERVAGAFRERLTLYGELPERARFLYEEVEPDAKAAQALAAPGVAELLQDLLAALEERSEWPPADLPGLVREVAAGRGAKPGAVMKPLRAALTGTLGGPELVEVLDLLGRERSLARLRRALATGARNG